MRIDKKTGHPNILMVDGKQLHHPALEQSNRTRMKILPIHSAMVKPMHTIAEVFGEAIKLEG